MSSGGNLDKRTFVDLGNMEVQVAVMHSLDVRFVKVVVLQPSCRTTGLPSYLDAKVNYDTWHEHHKEDLPHIKFSGKVVVCQTYLRRFYVREQPVGTRVDQIPPWTTLANSRGTCKAYVIPMGYQYENRLRSWLTIAYYLRPLHENDVMAIIHM
eukprot:2277276-Pyramimonas_sp.AAC.1